MNPLSLLTGGGTPSLSYSGPSSSAGPAVSGSGTGTTYNGPQDTSLISQVTNGTNLGTTGIILCLVGALLGLLIIFK
jgi:hypothetical protein